MSRRRKIIIVFGCGLLVIFFLLFRRTDEPYYKGRSLSRWVVSYANDTNETAAIAIREIGADAVPYFLKWIQYETPTNKQIWLGRINQPISWLSRKLGAGGDWTFKDSMKETAWVSPFAFQLLDQHASLAVPTLTRLLVQPENTLHATWAGQSLAFLGKPGLPPLMEALNSTNARVRRIAALSIHYLESNAQPAVPLLIQIIQKDDEGVAWPATRTLGLLRIDPDQVTPVLASALSSTNRMTSEYSGRALDDYGPLARPAIPTLTKLLESGDRWEHQIATYLLHAIDSKQFTNTVTPPKEVLLRRPVK